MAIQFVSRTQLFTLANMVPYSSQKYTQYMDSFIYHVIPCSVIHNGIRLKCLFKNKEGHSILFYPILSYPILFYPILSYPTEKNNKTPRTLPLYSTTFYSNTLYSTDKHRSRQSNTTGPSRGSGGGGGGCCSCFRFFCLLSLLFLLSLSAYFCPVRQRWCTQLTTSSFTWPL